MGLTSINNNRSNAIQTSEPSWKIQTSDPSWKIQTSEPSWKIQTPNHTTDVRPD